MRKNTLVVLVGISGSGKSTYARRKFPYATVYNADKYRFYMCGDELDQSKNVAVFNKMNSELITSLDSGMDCVYDNTNLGVGNLKDLLKQVNRKNINVIGFVLDCDVKTALNNQKNRERKVPTSVIERQYKQYVENIELIKPLFDRVYTVNAKR